MGYVLALYVTVQGSYYPIERYFLAAGHLAQSPAFQTTMPLNPTLISPCYVLGELGAAPKRKLGVEEETRPPDGLAAPGEWNWRVLVMARAGGLLVQRARTSIVARGWQSYSRLQCRLTETSASRMGEVDLVAGDSETDCLSG